MSYIYFACLKATHVQVLHILWFILDLFLELSCNAFKAIFSYRPLSSSLVFFDTPFSFLCAHKNCCTHATSFTQRLVIQLARSFLPSYFLMHLSSMCLFRARLHCWDISESLLPIPFSRCTMPSTRTPRRPISTFPTIRTRGRPSSTSMHVSSSLICRANVHVNIDYWTTVPISRQHFLTCSHLIM